MALKIADFFIWAKNRALPKFFRPLVKILLTIGKFTILPIVVLIYKNIVLIKIKLKILDFRKLNYLLFIKKYLPGITIAIIIFVASTNNIFAQNGNADEYANYTLLSSLVKSNESQWSEIIEDTGPANTAPRVTSYLEQAGNLQELVFNHQDIDYDSADNVAISPDDSSLVILGPQDNEPTKTTRTSDVVYVVQNGDVLGSIAEKFGVTVNTVLWANNLTWNSTIRPGQKLTIPPGSGIDYEVQRGDTLASIANKYQSNVDKIIAANELASATSIQVGDLLFLPDGVKPTQVVSSYKPPKKVAVVTPNTDDDYYNGEATPYAANINTGTKLLWPVLSHRITQYFSWRHTGLDIGDSVGNPIYAAEDGKVQTAGWNSGGYGNYVIINHGNGIQTLYGHASKVLVSAGDSVSRGQMIALVGSTGRSTGPHLHLEVRVGGVRKNPINYIK